MRSIFGRPSRFWFLAAVVGLGGSISMALTNQGSGQTVKQDVKTPVGGENDMDAALAAASAKIAEGRIDDALAVIKERAAKHPEWPPPYLILAQLLFAANQHVFGRNALERAAALAPDHPDVYLSFGELAMAEGRFSDARLNFERVLVLVGSGQWDAEKTRGLRIASLRGLAMINEAREDWKGAESRLTSWLEIDPKNGHARQRLAQAQFRLGRPEEAFGTLKQAVKDTPALDPAGVTMAQLYGSHGDDKKAEEWFDYAKKVEPKSALVRMRHAFWKLDHGTAADARKEIDEALKLDPKSKDAQKVSALIAWHLRDLAGAQPILEALHQDAPADAFSANLLALVLVEQEDAAKTSRGLQLAEVNAAQFPQSPDVSTTLGWALYRAGRVDEADKKLRAGIAAGRNTPDVRYFLARVLADKGKIDDARAILTSAIRQSGAFAHRDDATALLKTLAKAPPGKEQK